jgi:DNA-binding CsgD family transcriptional regulator
MINRASDIPTQLSRSRVHHRAKRKRAIAESRSACFLSPQGGSVPPGLASSAEQMISARGDPLRIKRVFGRGRVPMVIVDGERRYVAANTAARLALRLTWGQLRELRIDDLTAPNRLPAMHDAWALLTRAESMAGRGEVSSPHGVVLQIAYYALQDALPGLYLIAFVPAGWPESEFFTDSYPADAESAPHLTLRELEVLQLTAEGYSAPIIARELVVSVETVRTHLTHIYTKLSVRDRARAVAMALRLDLIC